MCRKIADFESTKNAEQLINELNLSDSNKDNSKDESKTKTKKK